MKASAQLDSSRNDISGSSFQKGYYIVNYTGVKKIDPFGGHVSAMRCQHHLFKRKQRMIRRRRLLIVNIETCTSKLPRHERLHQGFGLHDAATRAVDQKGGRLHQRELTLAQQMPAVIGEPEVKADNIRSPL